MHRLLILLMIASSLLYAEEPKKKKFMSAISKGISVCDSILNYPETNAMIDNFNWDHVEDKQESDKTKIKVCLGHRFSEKIYGYNRLSDAKKRKQDFEDTSSFDSSIKTCDCNIAYDSQSHIWNIEKQIEHVENYWSESQGKPICDNYILVDKEDFKENISKLSLLEKQTNADSKLKKCQGHTYRCALPHKRLVKQARQKKPGIEEVLKTSPMLQEYYVEVFENPETGEGESVYYYKHKDNYREWGSRGAPICDRYVLVDSEDKVSRIANN